MLNATQNVNAIKMTVKLTIIIMPIKKRTEIKRN